MVIINGAGIAGLTLANALQRKNTPFIIVEKAPEHGVLGAGIMLQNNGLAILEKLGLLPLLATNKVQQMAIGQRHKIRRVGLSAVGLECRVVQRQQLQKALLANLPLACIRLNASIVKCEVSLTGVSVTLSDQTTLTGCYVVNAAGIRSDLHAPVVLRDTGHWCWRALIKLNKPISCSGEYWFGRQRVGIAPVSDELAYVFHVAKLGPAQLATDYSVTDREQWLRRQVTSIADIESLQLTGQTWLSHPLQDRQIDWGHGRLVAIGDAAHAMTPNLGQGAVLAMEDAMELAHLLAIKHADPASELARIRHKRVAQMHRLSYWLGNIAHLDNAIANSLKTAFFEWMPLQKGLTHQVNWMNQFTQRLKEI